MVDSFYRYFSAGLFCMLLGMGCTYLPAPESPTDGVVVTEETQFLLIEPEAASPETNTFVFYPGGLVDVAAYESILAGIATEGYRIVVPRMPANLAVFDSDAARKVEERFPQSKHWIIGGHSLGAAMACTHLNVNRDKYQALILLAGYPAQNQSLADWPGAALSLSAEFDGLATPLDIEEGKKLLPEAEVVTDLGAFPSDPTSEKTLYYEIKGGNHAGFGSYGAQNNDGEATISVADQHATVQNVVLSFFTSNGW